MNTQEYLKRYTADRALAAKQGAAQFDDEKLLLSLSDYFYTKRTETPLECMSHRELVNFFQVFSKSIGLEDTHARLTATDLKHWAQENDRVLKEREDRLLKLGRQLTERDGQMRDLEQKVEELNRYFTEQSDRLAGRDQELAERSRQLAEQDKQIVDLNRQLAEQDQAVVGLNRTIAQLEQTPEVAERDRKLVELSKRFFELDQRIVDRDRRLEELGELLSKRDQQNRQELEQRLAEQNKQISGYQQQLTGQQKLLSAQEAAVVAIKQRLTEKGVELEFIQKNSSKHEIRSAQLETEVDRLHQEISVYKDRIVKIYTSSSWRMTKPFRSFMMAIRRTKEELPSQNDIVSEEKEPGTEQLQVITPAESARGGEAEKSVPDINTDSKSELVNSQSRIRGTTHVFTSINACYIPKARAMAWSIKKVRPDLRVHLVLSDRLPEWYGKTPEPFDSVILLEDLPIPDHRQWIFKHSLVELCTAVKGYGFQEIFRRYDCDKVLFFDPDAVIFGGIDELEKRLDDHSILLTPHQLVPESSHEAIVDNEICSLKHGIYNLGFLGIRGTETGRKFLDWWVARLHDYCYDDICGGLFTDQRWIDLAIAFFDDFFILREPNFNVATWNLTHRIALGSLEEGIYVNGKPLAFFHFSGFDSGAQEVMLRKYGKESPVLFQLREWYLKQLEENGQNTIGDTPWAYACFENGEPIRKRHRIVYRTRQDLQKAFPDPFAVPSGKDSFYEWYMRRKGSDIEAECESDAVLQDELNLMRREIDTIYRSRSWRLARTVAGAVRFNWWSSRNRQHT